MHSRTVRNMPVLSITDVGDAGLHLKAGCSFTQAMRDAESVAGGR